MPEKVARIPHMLGFPSFASAFFSSLLGRPPHRRRANMEGGTSSSQR